MIKKKVFDKTVSQLKPLFDIRKKMFTDMELFEKIGNNFKELGFPVSNGSADVCGHIDMILGMDLLKIFKNLKMIVPFSSQAFPFYCVFQSMRDTVELDDPYNIYRWKSTIYDEDARKYIYDDRESLDNDLWSPSLIGKIDNNLKYDLLHCMAQIAIDGSHNEYVSEDGHKWIMEQLSQVTKLAAANMELMMNKMDQKIQANKNSNNKSNYISEENNMHGYVYILTNPSMSGLVKIGMTTNNPSQRVKELSSATGVPTPFQLVYYREFYDCKAAESKIHSLLSEKRYNTQREFFEMETTEAINMLLSLENPSQNVLSEFIHEDNKEIDNVNIFETDGYKKFAEGMNYLTGISGYQKSNQKAVESFQTAINLGYKRAWLYLANCYLSNHDDYIKTLKQGAADGCPQCYLQIVDSIIDDSYMDDSLTKTKRDYIYRCLDLFIRQINLAYKIDQTECVNAIHMYIFQSLSLNRKIDKDCIAKIVRRIKLDGNVDEDDLIVYYYPGSCTFDNYELILAQSKDTMNEILKMS